MCNLNVATNYSFTNRDGVRTDETTWFRVSVWGRQAENCARYLAKGRKVLVVGRVSARAYTANDGEVRASLEIRASTVQFLSGRGEDEDVAGRGFGSSGGYSGSSRDSGTRIDESQAVSGGEGRRSSGTTLDAEDEGDIPF